MKGKKVVAVAAAALMAAAAVGTFAGCADWEHTIDIFLLANDNETQFYQKYFKDLEEELKEEGFEYKIKFNGEQEGNYYDALKAAINRGATPDIFYVRPNELLQYKDEIVELQSYADGAGKEFVNLDDIYDTALNMYRFNPETGALGNATDKLYAFPKDLSTQQLGYNKTLLKKYEEKIKDAGLTLPWDMDWSTKTYTWDEYKDMCKVIADNAEANNYACDVPSIEILAHSFGGDLIDLSGGRAEGKINSLAEGSPINKAIKYQAELVDCGAADYERATYSNFSAGRVCFYGLVGSWEIADYNKLLGKDNWEVMPWPTVDGSTNWAGRITSAGYVVSQKAAAAEKGDIVKRIAISFMSNNTQNKLVRESQISLPLIKSWATDYKSAATDSVYTPKSRGVFLDVISGEHGFFPATYSTYDKIWIDQLDTALEVMWKAGKGTDDKGNPRDGALKNYAAKDWASVQADMQSQYNDSKNK